MLSAFRSVIVPDKPYVASVDVKQHEKKKRRKKVKIASFAKEIGLHDIKPVDDDCKHVDWTHTC